MLEGEKIKLPTKNYTDENYPRKFSWVLPTKKNFTHENYQRKKILPPKITHESYPRNFTHENYPRKLPTKILPTQISHEN